MSSGKEETRGCCCRALAEKNDRWSLSQKQELSIGCTGRKWCLVQKGCIQGRWYVCRLILEKVTADRWMAQALGVMLS